MIAAVLLWLLFSGVGYAAGSLPVDVPITLNPATCPQGTAYVPLGDGCTGAQGSGSVLIANFYTGYTGVSYAHRPSWNSAGIDYAIGYAGTMRDPTIPGILPSCATFSGTGPFSVTVITAPCNLSHFDFSLYNGICVTSNANGAGLVVFDNDHFAEGSGCNPSGGASALLTLAGSAPVTVQYSDFRGTQSSNPQQLLVVTGTLPTLTVLYSGFFNTTQAVIEVFGGPLTLHAHYNYAENIGDPVRGRHGDWMIQFSDASMVYDDAWNVIYMGTSFPTANCYITSGAGDAAGTPFSGNCSHNTYVGKTPRSGSMLGLLVTIDMSSNTGNLGAFDVSDDYMDTAFAFDYYTTVSGSTITGPVTCSGNIDLNSGAVAVGSGIDRLNGVNCGARQVPTAITFAPPSTVSVADNIASGTTISTASVTTNLGNAFKGYLTLISNAGGRVALSGNNIVAAHNFTSADDCTGCTATVQAFNNDITFSATLTMNIAPGASPTITSVSMSCGSGCAFTAGSAGTIGTASATLSSGSFSGTWSLTTTGTDHAGSTCNNYGSDFSINSSTGVVTNTTTPPAGSYPGVCLTATQAGVSNSPYTQAFTFTGNAPSGTCPQGTAFVGPQGPTPGDGCQGAQATGSVLHSNFFTAYTGTNYTTSPHVRPPWNVAGVDYPVGYSGSLTSAATVTLPGCASRTGSGSGPYTVTVNSAPCTLSHIDFSVFNGVCVTVNANGASQVLFDNDKFLEGTNCNPNGGAILDLNGTAPVVIQYTEFDGNHSFGGTGIATFISPNTAGSTVTAQYDAFLSPIQAIFEPEAGLTLHLNYSYMENIATVPNHGDIIIFNQFSGTGTQDQSWNNILAQAPGQDQNWTAGCYATAGGNPGVTTGNCDYNVIIGPSSGATGAIVNIDHRVNLGTWDISHNYIDPRIAAGIATSGSGGTFSGTQTCNGNVLMLTGGTAGGTVGSTSCGP